MGGGLKASYKKFNKGKGSIHTRLFGEVAGVPFLFMAS